MNQKIIIDGYTCYCSDNNIHIVDSYKVKKIDEFLVKLNEKLADNFHY